MRWMPRIHARIGKKAWDGAGPWGLVFFRAFMEKSMAQASKNSRTSSATQKFFCSCGGEVKMKTLYENGKVRNVAECEKCKRSERRPSDFK
jgi:hypothetical protein